MVLWEKNEPTTVSIRFHTIHIVKTNLWKSQILVLYITILYSAWEICSEKGAGPDICRDAVEQNCRDFKKFEER